MAIAAFSYNPRNWYWLADDGRLFSSARVAVVPQDNADYLAWLEGGWPATPWPRDEQGHQTNASLQAVLTPWSITIPA